MEKKKKLDNRLGEKEEISKVKVILTQNLPIADRMSVLKKKNCYYHLDFNKGLELARSTTLLLILISLDKERQLKLSCWSMA